MKFGDIDRYSILKPIGSGKYSNVFLGKRDDGKMCTIKVIKNIPQNKIEREVYVLQHISGIPNTAQFYDVLFDPATDSTSIVTEYHDGINPRSLFPTLTLSDIRILIYKLLQVLSEVHSRNFIHRDIKPGNLLIGSDKKSLTLIDWGLATIYTPGKSYSVRVSTLRYKAPELLLNYSVYDYGVDIWGVGVVLAEMLFKIPFFEGSNIDEMIASLANLWGTNALIDYIEKYHLSLSQEALSLFSTNSFGWSKLIGLLRSSKRDDDAIDLLQRLLTLDQAKRITAKDALKHPFFDPIRLNPSQD